MRKVLAVAGDGQAINEVVSYEDLTATFNQIPKTPKSTRKAIKKYQETHKADNYRNQTKSKAKKFIRDFARRDELLELRKMIDEKLKNE